MQRSRKLELITITVLTLSFLAIPAVAQEQAAPESVDPIPRAESGKLGLGKWTLVAPEVVLGSEMEGIVLVLTGPGGSPSNIREIHLQATFALQ